MEPLDYLRAIARRWRLVLACSLLAGAGAFATTPDAGPAQQTFVTYNATATLLSDPNVATRSLRFTQLFMQRGELPQVIADALGTGMSGPEVANLVSVETDDEIGTVTISASGEDPDEVVALVDTYAETSIAYFDSQTVSNTEAQVTALQGRLDALAADLSDLDERVARDPGNSAVKAERDAKAFQYQTLLQQRQAALEVPPTSGLSLLEKGTALPEASGGFTPPSSRSDRLLLGLVLGAFLGALLALVVDRVDTRVRDRREVQELSGTAVLAEVPRLTRAMRRHARPAALLDPSSGFAESHRALRSALTLLPARSLPGASSVAAVTHEPPNRVVLVVSGRSREGKSTTVANLAATIAATDRSVVVVDADLHQPTLAKAFGVPAGRGLADLAAAGSTEALDDVAALVRPTSVEGVWLLDAGTPELLPSVSPLRLAEVVRRVRDLADVVLVDVAPVLSSSDALDLTSAVDAALLVVRAGRSTREQLRHTTEILARTGVPVVGTVLVGVATTPLRRGRGSEPVGPGPKTARSGADSAGTDPLRVLPGRQAAGRDT